MALISPANFKSFTDYLASMWRLLNPIAGSASIGSATAGTTAYAMQQLLVLTVGLDDYEQESDLNDIAFQAQNNGNVQGLMGFSAQTIGGLNSHMAGRGLESDAFISDVPSYLLSENGSGGANLGSRFSCMCVPEFQYLYEEMLGTTLPYQGVMSPALQPDYNSAAPLGMGTCTFNNTFAAGSPVDITQFSEVLPVIEVITSFSGGGAAPQLTITGINDLGNSTTWGPTVITGGNNPTAALSGITITPVVAVGRQTVAFSGVTGIVIGSVLGVNATAPDAETIIVENVSGSNVTAVFSKPHGAGAAISGWTSTAVGAPSAGTRLRQVTALAISGGGGWAAGKIRVAGRQDRVGSQV